MRPSCFRPLQLQLHFYQFHSCSCLFLPVYFMDLFASVIVCHGISGDMQCSIEHRRRNPLILGLNPMNFVPAFRPSFFFPYQVSKVFDFIFHRSLKFARFMHAATVA